MLFSKKEELVQEYHKWAKKTNKEIRGGKVDEKDLRNLVTFLEIRELINDKEMPQCVTHEATIFADCTCLRCKNVVSKREKWGDTNVRISYQYCPFCGQHLKGDDEPTLQITQGGKVE